MSEVLIILSLICAYTAICTAYRFLTVDVYLNLAQASVDASRCSMLFDQIDNPPVDMESVSEEPEFDLPFIDLTNQPNWWYEIWLWDYIGRQIVAEHSAAHSVVHWPEFDAAQF